MPANFSPPVCPPTGEAGKTQNPVLCGVFPNCNFRKQWMAKNKILIYIVKANFKKS
jgi:hypothetical protein